MLQHILTHLPNRRWPLYGSSATRRIEEAALAQLPAHHLMRRAAQAVFNLGRALYPHARSVWIACGPGNNGGDGLLAAALWHTQLQSQGTEVCVTWTGQEDRLPADARFALQSARDAGVRFLTSPPERFDLAVDALLGVGIRSRTQGPVAEWMALLQDTEAPVLCVDLPSGLDPDTGHWHNDCPARPAGPRHTLSLLTLKPGLFTASGRDAAGDLWLDSLDCEPFAPADSEPDAYLNAAAPARARHLSHDAHKGSHGDLHILGGQDVRVTGQGMTGAALLAARAGLTAGAGRVYVELLGPTVAPTLSVDWLYPELMFRNTSELLQTDALARATTVCGCGGGLAVRECLPAVLAHSRQLVLDADALNAIADNEDWQHQLVQRRDKLHTTIITPHPLEAARLLGTDTCAIQRDRLAAARALADRYQCVVVLKGSGSVLAAPRQPLLINPTGNALLATAGTGDVLAGLIGAYWCARPTPEDPARHWEHAFATAAQAAYRHGEVATRWQGNAPLTASTLIGLLGPA
ncbi:MAG TPA: NAD(P)H-hydrate dehydratase [Macromonas sp.]|nr:NAD(P)H-hydrate dehydratase [Macromonas sp.]